MKPPKRLGEEKKTSEEEHALDFKFLKIAKWGPLLEQATYKNRQRLYLSEQAITHNSVLARNLNSHGKHGRWGWEPSTTSSATLVESMTDGSVPNTLVIANVEVVKPRVAAAEHISQVNRIRELPQNSNIVATHTDSPDVLIWDVESQPNRHAVLGTTTSRPDLVLTGHQDNAEFALAMCSSEPLRLAVLKSRWNLLGRLERTSQWSYGVSMIISRHWQQNQDPQNPLLLVATSKQSPRLVKEMVEKAHDADLHCVDWNPYDENLILTGSADNSVHMFDRRNVSTNGVGSPVHKFQVHDAPVLCVQWSPHNRSIFGSAAEDGVLNIWDYDKFLPLPVLTTFDNQVGRVQAGTGDKMLDHPAGLFFRHAGHRDKVVDFHWNSIDPWTVVSVSDDCSSSAGGGTLQMWRIIDLLYRPEDEVVAELDKFRSHLILFVNGELMSM
ncbi:hypothetical protein Cgig2_022301 [Carnegiea gigantea]|uniref:Uncharacterized protein n=1 Tax=Carnegiea gigantea TaxID=171969 RepID=A0A9Q1QJZ1_9CARY|nr:hypothetical protein Cgig2_022301 [Carnegiea gigantea]